MHRQFLNIWETKRSAAFALLIFMIAVILTVLGFEHLGGFIPCKLCLEQRQPWYAGIVLSAFVALLVNVPARQGMVRLLLALIICLLIYSLYLGIFHSGVEWSLWEGPGDCGAVSGGLTGTANDLLNQLNETLPPSCNEASGRFFGLSFAGWNVIATLIAMVLTARIFQQVQHSG